MSKPVTVTTVSVRFPKDGGSYRLDEYLAGCGNDHPGNLCGTVAASPGRTISRLSASIHDSLGRYWTAASKAFTTRTEVLIPLAWDASWYLPFDPKDFPFAGKYTVRVQAIDSTGRATAARSTFTVNWASAPATAVVAPPTITPEFQGSVTNSALARFTLGGALPGRGYECALDGKPFDPCEQRPTFGSLAEGSHRLDTRITSQAPGGAPSSPATFSWTVDTRAPLAVDVQASNNGGVPGRLDQGDTLTYTFSEALRPESVLAGWAGNEAAAVTLRVGAAAGVAGGGTLAITVHSGSASARLPALGTVSLGPAGYPAAGLVLEATLLIRGAAVILTIADPGGGTLASASPAAASPGSLTWRPEGGADQAGNPLANAGSLVTEAAPNAPDTDF